MNRFAPAWTTALRVWVLICVLAAARLAPGSAYVTSQLRAGDEALAAGDVDAAVAAYGELLEFASHRVAGYERLVDATMSVQRLQLAQVFLYALADLDGWNATRREQLEIVLAATGESERARALLHASLAQQPENARALQSLAYQQIDQRAWQDAHSTLARLLDVAPENAEAAYLAGLLIAPEDPEQARTYLARAGKDARWQTAADVILAALQAYDSLALTDAHTRLGVALVGLGEWEFAERAFDMALAVNAVNPTALAYRGFSLDQQGRDGLPDLQAALAMSPNDATIYYLLGQHWRLVDDRQAAYDAFYRAHWLDLDNPALAAEVGISLEQLNDDDGAEEWLTRAVDLAPDDVRWAQLLAGFYVDDASQDQLEARGLTFIELAVERAPDDVELRACLGGAHYRLSHYDQAEDELVAAIQLNPDSVRAHYYLGRVREATGDVEGAVDSYLFVVGLADRSSGFGLLADAALQRLGY